MVRFIHLATVNFADKTHWDLRYISTVNTNVMFWYSNIFFIFLMLDLVNIFFKAMKGDVRVLQWIIYMIINWNEYLLILNQIIFQNTNQTLKNVKKFQTCVHIYVIYQCSEYCHILNITLILSHLCWEQFKQNSI